MLLKELFYKDNIDCPEWLSFDMIDDYWEDGNYSFEDNTHKWRFTDELRNVEIRFDGQTCTIGAYFDDEFFVFEIITESEIINI